MKLLRLFVITSMLLAAFALLPGYHSASAADTCYSVSGTGWDGHDPSVGPMALSAGTTLTASASNAYGNVFMYIYSESEILYAGYGTPPHTVTLEITEDSNVTVFFGLFLDGDSTFSVTAGDCGGGASVIYPESIVQGTFVSDAMLYWEPGKALDPELVVETGKHVYAGGLDDSGMYRQVLIVCDWLWVPVESIGPNFDYPWNGTPLVDDFPIQSGSACVSGSSSITPDVNWDGEPS